jgi:hypothetical protein
LTEDREFIEVSRTRYNNMAARAVKHNFSLPFSKAVFREWLKTRFTNDGTTPCTYCFTPIDLLNCEIDHMRPIGRICTIDDLDLGNLCITCVPCNQIKGEMTGREYLALRDFLYDTKRSGFAPEGISAVFSRLQGHRKLVGRVDKLEKQIEQLG